jgi:hypothetical protein
VIVPVPPVGGVKATLTADELETVDVPMVGAFGFVVAVIQFEILDVPPELVAVTANV